MAKKDKYDKTLDMIDYLRKTIHNHKKDINQVYTQMKHYRNNTIFAYAAIGVVSVLDVICLLAIMTTEHPNWVTFVAGSLIVLILIANAYFVFSKIQEFHTRARYAKESIQTSEKMMKWADETIKRLQQELAEAGYTEGAEDETTAK